MSDLSRLSKRDPMSNRPRDQPAPQYGPGSAERARPIRAPTRSDALPCPPEPFESGPLPVGWVSQTREIRMRSNPAPMIEPPPDRYLGWREAKPLFGGISRTTAWRGVRAGWLPAPVQISPGRCAWRASDIVAWQSDLRPRTGVSNAVALSAPKADDRTDPRAPPAHSRQRRRFPPHQLYPGQPPAT